MKQRHSLAVLVSLFAICGLLVAVAAQADACEPAPPERVCLAAAEWGSAPDSRRPCYTVERLYEDGSGRIVIGSASTPLAACRIPNVTEEPGSFEIECSRIGRTGGLSASK